MWRERIIEAKKAKNITAKMMAEKIRIPETTIARILSGKTQTPRIDTVLDLGAAVGLTATELFAEAVSFIGDKDIAVLREELAGAQASIEAMKLEVSSLAEENAALKGELVTLKAEAALLQINLQHKEKIVALQEEIITLHHSQQKPQA